MNNISQLTKMEPDKKVKEINKFIELLKDETEDKNIQEKWSSYKKYEYYGIQVEPPKELFTAYYMKETQILDGKNKNYNAKNVIMVKNIEMKNWVIFYEEGNLENAKKLIKKLIESSKRYKITISEPKTKKISKGSDANVWITEATKILEQEKGDLNFILFLLGENSYIYPKLKVHSLCTNGYISQVVKFDSLYKSKYPEKNDKIVLSICSKILLQINAKLGGAIYKIKMDESLNGKKIMLVGVDSSKHKDKNNYGTGIAMVASINDTFTDFYNKVEIVKEENIQNQFHFCISEFIDEAI